MKRILVFLAVLLPVFSGCQEEDNPGCPDGECRFILHTQSMITTEVAHDNTWATIEEGDYLVFEYQFVFDDNPGIADDEYSDHLLFEIPKESDSFMIEGQDQLVAANTWFRRLCYCFNADFNPVSSGTITGKKLASGAWQVSIDVTIHYDDYSITVQRKGIYSP
jgi:hypothetical protein